MSDFKKRISRVKAKADEARKKGPIKDQSGVKASDEFIARTGGGTYGARETAVTLMTRVTRPISRAWYDSVVGNRMCLRCKGTLVLCIAEAGGQFFACKEGGHECYYVGFTAETDSGTERVY